MLLHYLTGQTNGNVRRIDFCMNICLFVSKKIVVSSTSSKNFKDWKELQKLNLLLLVPWGCNTACQITRAKNTTHNLSYKSRKFEVTKPFKNQKGVKRSGIENSTKCAVLGCGAWRALGHLIFRPTKTSAFQQNAQSRFASIVFHSALGPLPPSVARLTVSLILCSSGSNALVESRAVLGHSVSSKSPSRLWDRGEGVAGRKGRE